MGVILGVILPDGFGIDALPRNEINRRETRRKKPKSNKWYLVPAGEIDPKELLERNIPAHSLGISSPQELTGIAFPEENKKEVLELIGARTKAKKRLELIESPTNIPGVFLLSFQEFWVALTNYSKDKWELALLEKVLIENYKRYLVFPVVVHIQKERAVPIRDGKIHIFIGSSPRVVKSHAVETQIVKVFGHNLTSFVTPGFTPSGKGRAITDGRDEVVAEVIGCNIYILFKLGKVGQREERDHPRGYYRTVEVKCSHTGSIFRAILDRALPEIAYDKLKIPPELLNKEEKAVSKEEYAELILGAKSRERIEEIQKEAREQEQIINDSTQQLIAAAKKQEELESLSKEYQTRAHEKTEVIQKEYENLWRLPLVKDVEVKDNSLEVLTDTIYVEKIKIGKFRIRLFLNGRVRIHNLDNRREDCDHPHVREDRPCLGNLVETIPRLVAHYEFGAAIQLLMQFLQSYNPGSPFKQLEAWME